jgi:hypothetical protein
MRSLSAYVNLVPALAPRSPTGGITMAKNKNRDRKQPRAERASQSSQTSTLEPQDEQRTSQATPGEITARKGRQKRFGHN